MMKFMCFSKDYLSLIWQFPLYSLTLTHSLKFSDVIVILFPLRKLSQSSSIKSKVAYTTTVNQLNWGSHFELKRTASVRQEHSAECTIAVSSPLFIVLYLTAKGIQGALCNIRYPSQIHLKLKSCEISFAHNSCFSWPIALKFCTAHGSITAVLRAKFQTDWTIETDVMDERDFKRF